MLICFFDQEGIVHRESVALVPEKVTPLTTQQEAERAREPTWHPGEERIKISYWESSNNNSTVKTIT